MQNSTNVRSRQFAVQSCIPSAWEDPTTVGSNSWWALIPILGCEHHARGFRGSRKLLKCEPRWSFCLHQTLGADWNTVHIVFKPPSLTHYTFYLPTRNSVSVDRVKALYRKGRRILASVGGNTPISTVVSNITRIAFTNSSLSPERLSDRHPIRLLYSTVQTAEL